MVNSMFKLAKLSPDLNLGWHCAVLVLIMNFLNMSLTSTSVKKSIRMSKYSKNETSKFSVQILKTSTFEYFQI